MNALKMFKCLVVTVLSLAVLPEIKAQDPNYSQFYNNPLYYNPAYAGVSTGLRLRFDYRSQWPKLRKDFKTYNFNTDFSVRSLPGGGGVGLMFNKDKAGVGWLETTTAGIVTAVRIRLGGNTFTQVGITSSFVQKYVDWDKFVFSDEIDPRYGNIFDSEFIPPGDNRVAYPDFNVGALFRFVKTTWTNTNVIGTFGLAAHHVFEPNESLFEQTAPLPRKYVVHADMIFESESYTTQHNSVRFNSGGKQFLYHKLNPGLYYMKQGSFQSYGFGVNIFVSNLYGGIWYRNDDFDIMNTNAIILSLGINARFNQDTRLKIKYSYDLSLNDELTTAGGAHEISILVELDDFSFKDNNYFSGKGVKTGRGRVVAGPLECSSF